jgi:hypothetical protein
VKYHPACNNFPARMAFYFSAHCVLIDVGWALFSMQNENENMALGFDYGHFNCKYAQYVTEQV